MGCCSAKLPDMRLFTDANTIYPCIYKNGYIYYKHPMGMVIKRKGSASLPKFDILNKQDVLSFVPPFAIRESIG